LSLYGDLFLRMETFQALFKTFGKNVVQHDLI
jgi:hypothetical protein